MAPHWFSRYDKLTETEVATLEGKLGVALPERYRSFLIEVNGREPEAADVDIKLGNGETLETSVAFLDARSDSSSGIAWARNRAFEGILHDCVPFAVDGGGNYFCLEAPVGSVTFFFHGRPSDGRVPIAHDFSGFLEMLYSEVEDGED